MHSLPLSLSDLSGLIDCVFSMYVDQMYSLPCFTFCFLTLCVLIDWSLNACSIGLNDFCINTTSKKSPHMFQTCHINLCAHCTPSLNFERNFYFVPAVNVDALLHCYIVLIWTLPVVRIFCCWCLDIWEQILSDGSILLLPSTFTSCCIVVTS